MLAVRRPNVRVLLRIFGMHWLFVVVAMFSSSLQAKSFEAMLMPGPVIEGHAKYENECEKCHQKFNKSGQKNLCAECHKEVWQDYAEKRGYHGRLDNDDCRDCHLEHKGRNYRAAEINSNEFDHSKTDFALTNAHGNNKIKCTDCHLEGKKLREVESTCVACHRSKDVHKGVLGSQCEDCHTDITWKEAKFDHDKTKFKLTGKHAEAKCKNCHKTEDFQKTPSQCAQCHKNDDKHKTKFGDKCGDCHNDKSWKEILFKHDRDTKYRLVNRHAEIKCDACHLEALFQSKTPTTCYQCHRSDDDKKGHKGTFGDKCERCHRETKWKDVLFDHNRDTKYLLKDSHILAKCDSCHQGILYRDKAGTLCISCHEKDDKAKGGHNGRYGKKCESCHSERKWKETKFDHNRDTRYVLAGKHTKVKCDDCHSGRIYEDKLAIECIACHQKHDEHKAQLGKKCESCHVETSWKQAKFDHEFSSFPLLGKHRGVKCNKCHEKATFKDAKKQCFTCHEKADKHKRTLTTKCEICHVASDWKAWRFDHDKDTKFVLRERHTKVDCQSCHNKPAGEKVTVSSDCSDCHSHDDIHNGSFGRNCLKCHNETNFKTVKPR